MEEMAQEETPEEQIPVGPPPSPKTPHELVVLLKQYEDVESAILVYKEASAVMKQYEPVKAMARGMVEQMLRSTGESHVTTQAGTAGWTHPKTPKLDQEAWDKAMLEVPLCQGAQNAFDNSKHNLEQLQQPYMKMPDPTFVIR